MVLSKSKRPGKVNVKTLICLIILTPLFQSCVPKGTYVGRKMDPPAQKVVLFEIEGTDGKELTDLIGTQLTSMGIAVVYGNDYGKPSDSMMAAKIADDVGAQAFIRGNITRNEVVKQLLDNKYTIGGTFKLFSKDDDSSYVQIGGITNATLSATFKPIVAIGDVPSQVELRNEFAEHVANEICCLGLGGAMKEMKKMKHH